MTMTIDANQQRFGHLTFDNMSSYHNQSPAFTNPFATTSPSSHAAMYAAGSQPSLASHSLGLDRHAQQSSSRTGAGSSASMAPYGSIPVTTASTGSPLSMMDSSLVGQQDLLSVPQDLMNINRMAHHQSSAGAYAEPIYTTTAGSPAHATYAPSPASYDTSMGYAPAPVRSGFALAPDAGSQSRRYSQSSVSSGSSFDPSDAPRAPTSSFVDFQNNRGMDDPRAFRDAIEAGHGMVAMKYDTSNQETPRAGVYNSRGRGSGDSYGFPTAHSTSSSVSSTGFSPYYGSVDSSVSDYSTAGSDIESVNGSRTLPRPQGLMTNQPPAPQSMMGQFSSKVSSSTQKKHKCKVCDKRFTRPSSLQTHMYSHTGEKPFSCEVEGCGRHFSVVSNLRRHKKVHKGEAQSDTGSESHHSD